MPFIPWNFYVCCQVSQRVLFKWWRFCEFLFCVVIVSCSSFWVVTSPVPSSTFHGSGWTKFPPTLLDKQHFLPPVTSAPTWIRFSHPEDGCSIFYKILELTNLTTLHKNKKKKSPYLVMFAEACSPDSMICTRGCNYSVMYSRCRAQYRNM